MADELHTRHTLLHKLQDQRDDQAWEEFVLIYQPYIHVIIHNLGIQPSSIDDIKQAVLLKAWGKLSEFSRSKGKFRSWLSTVTINTVRDFALKEGRLKKFLESGHAIKLQRYLKVESKAEVEELAEKEWRRFIAEKAWESVKTELPGHLIEVFQWHMDGRPVAEIAQLSGLAENSVYVYRKRIQNRLIAEIYRLESDIG